LNIAVGAKDRDSLRFLWVEDVRDNNLSIVVYGFCRVVFRLNASPFLLNGTIRHHLDTFARKDPDFVKRMVEGFYVDDLVKGERTAKYFSRNKLPARFPEFMVRIKRSALQTLDGGLFQGKASSEDEITSSFRLIVIFLRHAPVLQLFHDNIFEHLRCFLNSLDLSIREAQAINTSTEVATNTSTPWKTPTNRRLEMPSTDVLSDYYYILHNLL